MKTVFSARYELNLDLKTSKILVFEVLNTALLKCG